VVEVFLRIEDEASGGGATDVAVQVEPSHTIAALSRALDVHLHGRAGRPPPALALVAASAPDPLHAALVPLDPGATVAGTGLLSGDVLRLGPDPHRAGRASPARRLGWELVVCSGPDAGRTIGLRPGTLLIGRDPSCGLVLSDPKLSRVHLKLHLGDPGAVGGLEVRPGAEARSEVRVNGQPVGAGASIGAGDLIVIGGTTLAARPVVRPVEPPGEATTVARTGDGDERPLGQIPFHRGPYYPSPVEPRVFDALGDVPEAPEPVRFAYLAAAGPLVMGVAMALVYSPRFLIFTAFAPVIALAAYVEQRRRNRRRYGRGERRFRERLAERRAEVDEALAIERLRRFLGAPDLADLAARARNRSVDLWVRDRQASDFLTLRLGLGDATPLVRIHPETRGDERLRQQLETELEPAGTLRDIPITVDLAELPVLALVGAISDTTALASSLVLQAACLHSPEDVIIVAGVTSGRAMCDWLKWLPHTRSASSPIGADHLATTTEGVDRLLTNLLVVAEARHAGADRTIDHRWPRLLVTVDRQLDPDPAIVSRLLDACPAAGISVIWLTASDDRVPRQARAVVTCAPPVSGDRSQVSYTDPASDRQTIEIERASALSADSISRSLAPVRDASSAGAASGLPRVVPLAAALGTDQLSADWVASRWGIDRGYSLAAPIGLAAGGPLVIDLVAHGPHGLIGGTSGAGKSELLMSMVAGLIASNSPRSLNLLFIDYKGGASSEEFKNVPHTVGHVTNLDGVLARRALISLRAELNRRMDLLQGRAKDLAGMIQGHGADAPPSLVIIVDEFATLVREIPEFVAGIVDIAQRGRSLGIHLVLATQRPSGAVNENILANTNLRICLRMLDGAESTSVIGTSDAASIPLPLKGRGFARLGPGELIAFQTAWSGAPMLAGGPGPPPVEVEPFRSVSTQVAQPAPRAEPAPPPGSGTTQIEELVAAVRVAADRLGLERGRSPWRDELPTHLQLAQVRNEAVSRWSSGLAPGANRARAGWAVPIAMLDDPEGQDQYPALIDLAAGGGLLVFGTGGSGKTTTLRVLAAAVALDHAEQADHDLTLLGLDFASRGLTAIGALPQCAAVATGDELEAVTRIVAMLDGELQRRRAEVAAATRDGLVPPVFGRVLLLIDDYGNLAQTFEGAGAGPGLYQWLEMVNRVIVDGRQVGIHTAATATRRATVKASVLSAVANRIVLRQADPAAYVELGLPAAAVGDGDDLPPGRGYLNGPTLVQVAALSDRPRPTTTGDGEPEALRAMASHVCDMVASVPRPGPALATSPLPDDMEPLAVDPADAVLAPMVVPLGVSDLALEVIRVDLSAGSLTLIGDPRSGRTTALATIGHHLASAGCEVWLVGPAGSRLGSLDKAARAVFGRPADIAPVLDELAAMEAQEPGEIGRVLLIDDVDLLEDPVLDPPSARLISAGAAYVASTMGLRGYSTNAIVQDMKKNRSLLYLRPSSAREVQELAGCTPSIRPGLAMVPGRGVLVVNRVPTVLQVANYFAG
jgi:S-DNA-T family DNA segregation ATPase FtsK/SpoIIIE